MEKSARTPLWRTPQGPRGRRPRRADVRPNPPPPPVEIYQKPGLVKHMGLATQGHAAALDMKMKKKREERRRASGEVYGG